MAGENPLPIDPEPDNVTEENAARRFYQMRNIERSIAKLDKRIADKQTELKALKEEREGELQRMLGCARNEGPLPLFEDM